MADSTRWFFEYATIDKKRYCLVQAFGHQWSALVTPDFIESDFIAFIKRDLIETWAKE